MREFYTSEVLIGAPSTFTSETQKIIYAALDNAKVEYTRIESDPGITMDDCLNIDKAFGIETVKTILLTNRQKNRFWLYVTHARKPFVTKDFGKALAIPRVSFADEESMQRILGTPHGAATPLALVMPSAVDVVFVMDRDVAGREKIVITEGIATGFIAISLPDLYHVVGRKPVLIDNQSTVG